MVVVFVMLIVSVNVVVVRGGGSDVQLIQNVQEKENPKENKKRNI